MKTEIGSQITITDPTDEIIQWCKENLVLNNPDYIKKQRMGFWVGNTPRTLTLYEEIEDKVVIPYGCLRSLLPMLAGADNSNKFITLHNINLSFFDN